MMGLACCWAESAAEKCAAEPVGLGGAGAQLSESQAEIKLMPWVPFAECDSYPMKPSRSLHQPALQLVDEHSGDHKAATHPTIQPDASGPKATNAVANQQPSSGADQAVAECFELLLRDLPQGMHSKACNRKHRGHAKDEIHVMALLGRLAG
jgi:hypothetical protein